MRNDILTVQLVPAISRGAKINVDGFQRVEYKASTEPTVRDRAQLRVISESVGLNYCDGEGATTFTMRTSESGSLAVAVINGSRVLVNMKGLRWLRKQISIIAKIRRKK